MMETGRRGFLGMLAAAPAALPVVAKEAAAKMSLTAVTNGNAMDAMSYGGPMADCSSGDISWARKALKEMMSVEQVNDRMQEARRMSRVLDPDLAAMRSMSPAVAYNRQIERHYAQLTQERRNFFERQIGSAGRKLWE